MSFEKFCAENGITVKKDELMKNHTSFKIGGAADFFVECCNAKQLEKILTECEHCGLPYFVLGKGSNLLVSDSGVEGVVISLAQFCDIEICGDELIAGAGVTLARLCAFALENCLSGIEFAYGIPGSVGGALYMNAGAYGGEMSQVVLSATVMDKKGKIYTISVEDMCLGYRTSIFKTNGDIILSVKLKLQKGDSAEIKSQMEDYLCRRKCKQPLEFASAGSTFKRPEGHFAGALIEKNSLKGVTVGDAMVSEKHAGFLVNCGNATAKDVRALMEKVKATVLENDGIELEPEVIFVGRED